MGLRTRLQRVPVRVRKRSRPGAWERDLGLAPGERCTDSYVGYFEAGSVSGSLEEAFKLSGRGLVVNAVLTDRGRLVVRAPDGVTRPVAFDAKRPAAVEVLGAAELRLAGRQSGAERTKLVSIRCPGGPAVRVIVADSAVEAFQRWSAERPRYASAMSA